MAKSAEVAEMQCLREVNLTVIKLMTESLIVFEMTCVNYLQRVDKIIWQKNAEVMLHVYSY